MYDGNPHAPTTAWLESIAAGPASVDAEDGDENTKTFVRDGNTYSVTVAKNTDD